MTRDARPRYDEGCLAAHALNLVGDRWALLVGRELLLGPRRFGGLRAGLPGITAPVLSARLRRMIADGLIVADGGGYALTPLGQGLGPVLAKLCQWGVTVPGHDPRRFISPVALLLSMQAMVQPRRMAGGEWRAGLRMGGADFAMRLADGRARARAGADPDATFTLCAADGNAMASVVYGPRSVAGRIGEGALAVEGPEWARAQSFVDCFALRPPG